MHRIFITNLRQCTVWHSNLTKNNSLFWQVLTWLDLLIIWQVLTFWTALYVNTLRCHRQKNKCPISILDTFETHRQTRNATLPSNKYTDILSLRDLLPIRLPSGRGTCHPLTTRVYTPAIRLYKSTLLQKGVHVVQKYFSHGLMAKITHI